MQRGQRLFLMAMWALVALAGCAKKESNFEQAGKKMDAALQQIDRDLDKTVNQK